MSPLSLFFKENEPLSLHTSLKIGGNARYFKQISSVSEMQEALSLCASFSIPFLVIGKGSNILFEDRGFNGAILLNKIDFLEKKPHGIFTVGAGYNFSLLGTKTAKEGFTGLEFASGIPASVGGAIFMNAGANGKETSETLVSVDFLDKEGTLTTFLKEDLLFSYRFSSFQEKEGAILQATFQLKEDPLAREKQFKILDYRIKTQPYNEKSAGCIFKNPKDNFAGALIEKAGLKGFCQNGVEVSPLHANFIVNKGNATAADFLLFIEDVRKKVYEETGYLLESEVRCIPYEASSYKEILL